MQRVAFALQQIGGDVADVVALVAVSRKRKALAAGFQISQPDAGGQNVHLPTGIVDVVLAMYQPAIGNQQVGHASAKRTMATVTHVQRPGRVRRDKFHNGLALCTAGIAAEGIT